MAARLTQETVETAVVRTTTQAREGVTGHGVRYVLLTSTALVVILFAAIWLPLMRALAERTARDLSAR